MLKIARYALAGSDGYDKYIRETTQALQAVGLYSGDLLEQLSTVPASSYAIQRLFQHGSVDHIRNRAAPPTGIGLEVVRAALKQGHGLILGCTHVGNFYEAFAQFGLLHDEVLIVTGNQNYSERMVARMCELSGIRIRVVPSATRSSLAIARHLKRGGVVATMLDLYSDATLSLESPFFGRLAATPAGIYQLSVMTGAPIVPMAVVPVQGRRVAVEFDAVVEPAESAEATAASVNRRLEQMIRRHPELWSVWPSLLDRWRLAQEHIAARAPALAG